MYMIIVVTAEKLTGEVTVAPLAGEQIFTVLSTVAMQVCAEATLADARRRVAVRKTRSEITRGPFSEETSVTSGREMIRHWDMNFGAS
jgi:methyl coenzyme M reductase subunit C-like uncharacterized protein (methanogenesis marker protein 7)